MVDLNSKISYHTPSPEEKKMAQHKSAIRQWKRSLHRQSINRKNKSILKTQIKKMRMAIEKKDKEEAEKLLPLTFSIIDKSVKKGTIHPKTGQRYKSRLSQQLEMIQPSAPK
jgi:small subunit ribosomal protein S20